MSRTSELARLALVLVATLLCLAWALAGVELAEVWGALRTVELSAVLAAIGLTTLGFLLRVQRFQLLLGPDRPTFRRQLVVCGIGFLAINVVPLRLGELVRSSLLREDGVPWGRSLGAVAVERVLDLFSLLGMLLLVSLLVELPAQVLVQGIDVLAAGQRGIGLALIVLITALVALLLGGERVLATVERLPVAGPRAATFARGFRASIAELLGRPLDLALAALLAVAVWSSTITTVYVLLAAFPGLPTGPDVALAVTAFTVAGMVAIPTPGFFGPFEAFCKATLVLWGVGGDEAAALALLWHAIAFGFHVVTGGFLLVQQGLSLGTLVRESRR